jgi:hypothetical protein
MQMGLPEQLDAGVLVHSVLGRVMVALLFLAVLPRHAAAV